MFSLKIIIIFLISNITANNNLLPKSASETSEDLSDYAVHIAANYCRFCNFVAVITEQNIFRKFVRDTTIKHSFKFYLPLMIIDDFTKFKTMPQFEVEKQRHIGRSRLFLVYLDHESSNLFHSLIHKMKNLPHWRANTRLLLIFTKIMRGDDTRWLRNIFHLLWQHHIIRVVAIYWNRNIRNLEVVTYDPFIRNFYMNMTGFPMEFDVYFDKTANVNKFPINAMIKKGEEMMFNLPIETKDAKFKDVNTMVMIAVMQAMNARVIKIYKSTLEPNTKDTSRNLSKTVPHFTADVIFIATGMIKERNIQLLYPHGQDDICVIVPKGHPIPQIYYMFMTFRLRVWIILFAVMAVGVLGYFCINYYAKNSSNNALSILRTMLLSPLPHLPPTDPERLTVFSWLVFGFLMANIFISSLTSTLIERKYYPDVTTLADLEKTGWKIFGMEDTVNLIKTHLNETFDKEFLDRFDATNLKQAMSTFGGSKRLTNSNIYSMLVKVGKPILLERVRAHHLLMSSENIVDGRKFFTLMPDCPLPSQVSYGVMKGRGAVYKERIDILLKRLTASGLYSYWQSMYEMRNLYRSVHDGQGHGDDSNDIHLGVYHLQTCFYLYTMGITISFCAFFAELYVYKIKLKQNRQMPIRYQKSEKPIFNDYIEKNDMYLS